MSCSCLKASYRDFVKSLCPDIVFVYLSVSKETVEERLAVRKGHFFDPALVESQFMCLEAPSEEEAFAVDGSLPLDTIVDRIEQMLVYS